MPDNDSEQVQTDSDQAIAMTDKAFNDNSQQLIEIEDAYLDGSYDKESIIRRIEQSKVIIGQQIYFIGRDLVMLKERGEHGQFADDLKRMGIEPRTARRYMSIAVKFNSPKLQKLVNGFKDDKGALSKLIELSTEGDEDLEALMDGGTIAGIKLDEIDRMSARELRTALRKSRHDAQADGDAHDRMLTTKNKHADELADKLAKAEGRPKTDRWPAQVETIDEELSKYAHGAEQYLTHVLNIINVINSDPDVELPAEAIKALSSLSIDRINRLAAIVAEMQNAAYDKFGFFINQPTYELSDPLTMMDEDKS